MNFLEPWYGLSENEKQYFENELRREITPRHNLAGLVFEAIGKNGSNDDVLFKIKEHEYELVVVHLIWNGNFDSSFPWSQRFKDWDDFTENRMKQDNYGYSE